MNLRTKSSLCLGLLIAFAAPDGFCADAGSGVTNGTNSMRDGPRYIGPVTEIPEWDTFALAPSTSDCTSVPRYSTHPRLMGDPSGDVEKDTFGLVAEEQTVCTR